MRKFSVALLVLALGMAANQPRARAQNLNIPYVAPRPANTLVMLPDGSTVHVELAQTQAEQEYGLMGRTHLPAGRGMLFVHTEMKDHAYWMYHCRIGLDIIWMDAEHRIVEMSPDTPPCRGASSTCPSYGGHEPSQYVLELPVGSIRKHGLKVGERIEFRLA
jgi:hypothetical protein